MSKDIFSEFNKLKTDKEKWEWVIENKDSGIKVLLDNDDTFLTHDKCEDWGRFKGYIGYSDGVFSLLAALGIPCECV